jgi:hypothetical protein
MEGFRSTQALLAFKPNEALAIWTVHFINFASQYFIDLFNSTLFKALQNLFLRFSGLFPFF